MALTPLLQAVLNGLIAGSFLAIPAIGFTTIFAILRYPSFAIAAYATIGGFAGWLVDVYVAPGLIGELIAAALAAAIVAYVGEQGILSRLRPAGALTVAIGSMAMGLVLENMVRFSFGNELRTSSQPLERDIVFMDLRLGPQQLRNMATAIVLMIAIFAFLRFTRFGRAMRAVADNPDLAKLKGIDPKKIAGLTIAVSAALIGIGGLLFGLDTSVDTLLGNRILIPVFAAAVLGGLGSIPGAVVGALVLGVAEEITLLFISPIYRSAVGFLAILIILSFRPRGLFGEKAV